MFCMKCGKKIDNDSKFCPFCGSAIGSTAQSNEQTQRTSTGSQIPSLSALKAVKKPISKNAMIGMAACAVVILLVTVVTISVTKKAISSARLAEVKEDTSTTSDSVEDNADKSVSAPIDDTEVEETDAGNDIYYLSESDIANQLYGFVNFCKSKGGMYTGGDWDGSYRSLQNIAVDRDVDIGLVAIYETSPEMILTEDYADICYKTGHQEMDWFLNDIWRDNDIEFTKSNIHETWHYYDGTDAKVYICAVGTTEHLVLEMVQCSGEPHRWLINNIIRESDAESLLRDKLKNEDGVEWATEPVLSAEELFNDYINENISGNGAYEISNITVVNQSGLEGCLIHWVTAGGFSLLVIDQSDMSSIIRHDISPELNKITGEAMWSNMYYDEEKGHLYTEERFQGECHVRNNIEGDYDDYVDYEEEKFLFGYFENAKIEVEYSQTCIKEYELSQDGKILDLVDSHSRRHNKVKCYSSEGYSLDEFNASETDGCRACRDTHVNYLLDGKSRPQFDGLMDALDGYCLVEYPEGMYEYYKDIAYGDFFGSYEDYVAKNGESDWIYRTSSLVVSKEVVDLDEYVRKSVEADAWWQNNSNLYGDIKFYN